MRKIVIATGNAHKIEEFGRMFAAENLPVTVVSAEEFGGMPPVPEDTGTFAGNVRQKAFALRMKAGPPFWILADDSGLVCDALNGKPGVESANYAGRNAGDSANRKKLLEAMKSVPDALRTAHFECHLLLVPPCGAVLPFVGKCFGKILESENGTGGFGYDPLFLPDGEKKSFAELDAARKDALSHRGRAFAQLAEFLRR